MISQRWGRAPQKGRETKRRWGDVRRAFTMIELMMVLIICGLLLSPVYRLFKSGSQTSLQGMQQIEMVLEGRRLIRQIHNDLKHACKALPAQTAPLAFTDLLQFHAGSTNSLGNSTFSFFSFPLHQEIKKVVSADQTIGNAPRYVSSITYLLEPLPDSPFYRLVREEKSHQELGGQSVRKTLSERVNYFEIQPRELQTSQGKSQWFFNVLLQLGEARDPQSLRNLPANSVAPANRTEGLLLVEFFDVVYSEFFSAIWNQEFMGRSWHTGIVEPD